MHWQKISLKCKKEHFQEIEDFLFNNNALSISFLDAKDQPILEPGVNETPIWDEITINTIFGEETNIDAVISKFKSHTDKNIYSHLESEIIQDKNWVLESMNDLKPMQFGDSLWVCPSWITPPDINAVNIMLDPGLGFGTGNHPTTELCLKWLYDNGVAGKSVIDYGCGSGILCIAAHKLGSKNSVGIDNDNQAIISTKNNAEKNNISDNNFQVYLPQDVPDHLIADIVIANILSNILIDLRFDISNKVEKNGYLVMSGILDHQYEDVINAYSEWFKFEKIIKKNEWVLIYGKKYN